MPEAIPQGFPSEKVEGVVHDIEVLLEDYGNASSRNNEYDNRTEVARTRKAVLDAIERAIRNAGTLKKKP
mgnify:CR=1 FL=1